MSKNIQITITILIISVLSIGGFLVYSNSQKNNQASVSTGNNSLASLGNQIQKNEKENISIKNSIVINETGTINPKFASIETKEKYDVAFDSCKILTPEITEKYFVSEKINRSKKLRGDKSENSVYCDLNDDEIKPNNNLQIQMIDNNNRKDIVNGGKIDAKNELVFFKEKLQNIEDDKSQTNIRKLLKLPDNTIEIIILSNLSASSSKIAKFYLNNYAFEIRIDFREKYDDTQFENFVKEVYETIKA